jgi:hypothetical protein
MAEPRRRRTRRQQRRDRTIAAPAGGAPRATARARAWLAAHPVPVAAGLAALHMVLALAVMMPAPHTGGDNAVYITLGRSLLERGDYLSLHLPGEPAHTQYPPAFPALLALAMAVGLQPWVPLKLLVAACSAGAIGFGYLFMHRRRHYALALAVGGLLAVSPGVLEHTRWVLSDVPFWLLVMAAVWGFERTRTGGPRWPTGVAIAAVVLGYLTRSAGLPLALAAALWLAWRRRWRSLGALAAAFLPAAAGWWAWTRMHGGGTYAGQFWLVNPYSPELGRIGVGGLLQRVLDNAGDYLSVHLPFLLSGGTHALMLPVSVLVVAFGVYGWARRLRRAPGVAELFLPLYLGLILIWPAVWSGARFLLPAFPLIVFYAGDGLRRAVRRLLPASAPTAGALAGGAAFAVLLAAGMPALAREIEFGSYCTAAWRAGERHACLPPQWRDYYDLAEWSRDALPAGSAVLSRKPSLYYAFSGVPGDYYPLFPDPDSLFGHARRLGARYVVLDRMDALSDRYLAPALISRTDAFCIMTASQVTGTVLFGIVDDAEDVTGRDAPADPGEVGFDVCGADYWRDGDARDRMLQGY